MVSYKKTLLLCLLQYILILVFHFVYSIYFMSVEKTVRIVIWSSCILVVLILFGYIFQKQTDLVIYVTMIGTLFTVSYVGYTLETLAFGVLIFFAASLLLGMFVKPVYIIVWYLLSFPTAVIYSLIWPNLIKKMVPSLTLYYGYVFCYLVGGICTYILVYSTQKYRNNVERENELTQKDKLMKNLFWANISNEIRTPMNVINGMSRLLKSENLNVRSKEYTDQIENASSMLLTLVNDTLEFSHLEAGSYENINRNYNIYNMVHMAVLSCSSNIRTDSINLAYSVSPEVPNALYGNDEFIMKIITRLTNNILSVTDHGLVRIDISIADHSKINYVLKIRISNNGIGINNDLIKYILGNEDTTSKTTEQETISISFKLCNSMIEILGGKLKTEYDEKKGLSFEVTVSQNLGMEDALQKNNIVSTFAPSTRWKSPDSKVLIVDDTPTNLKLILGLVKLFGIEGDKAESGRECIQMMENLKYDLVFLDYMMPDMNGLDTLKVIKSRIDNENFDDVPIIALTSKSLQKDRNKFIEVGFDDFISKPIDDKELENILKKYLIKDR